MLNRYEDGQVWKTTNLKKSLLDVKNRARGPFRKFLATKVIYAPASGR